MNWFSQINPPGFFSAWNECRTMQNIFDINITGVYKNIIRPALKCILMFYLKCTLHISFRRTIFSIRIFFLTRANMPNCLQARRLPLRMCMVRCVNAKPFLENFPPFNELFKNKGPFELVITALSKMCCCHLELAAAVIYSLRYGWPLDNARCHIYHWYQRRFASTKLPPTKWG